MLITSGGMRVDYIITRKGQARTGLLGGNAIYSAIGAALWTNDVNIWSRVGSNYPRDWLEDLQEYGIGLDGLVRISGNYDHRTFYAYTPDGIREDTNPEYHFNRIGLVMPEALEGYRHSTPGQDNPEAYDPLAVRPDDWSVSFDGTKAVHLAPMPLRTHLKVPQYLRRRGVYTIMLDPGERYMRPEFSGYIREILPEIDVFLPSSKELRSLFGPEVSVLSAARTLVDWGATRVIVKLGAKGILIYEGTKSTEKENVTQLRPYHESGDSAIVDVTGAGDAFCGGYLAGVSLGMDSIQCARLGLVSASLVIEGYGALHALKRSPQFREQRLHAINIQ